MARAMHQIPLCEVTFHPTSVNDPSGRLFWWRGDLYRAISATRADLYRSLFDNRVVDGLVAKGLLVQTELTDLALEGCGLVLKHYQVPEVSYAYEWCDQMLKDAALLIADLAIELAQHDLALQDAHLWNVLFDGPHPVYVDFGSIVPANDSRIWPEYEEFCRFFLNPLRLMARGHGRIARSLLHEFYPFQGVLESEANLLLGTCSARSRARQAGSKMMSAARRCIPRRFRPFLRGMLTSLESRRSRQAPASNEARLAFLRGIRRQVSGIRMPVRRTEWSDYYDSLFPPFTASDEWTGKHHSVHKVLSDLCPQSVLDIGSNRGWYSQLAATLGSRVVALDVDEACVAKLYQDAKARDLPVLPVLMDFRNPSPGYGLCNEWFPPATRRLKCEMVLALALVHHLVFKQNLRFEHFVEGTAPFVNRWLLVEFVPPEDRHVREWWSERFSWYTLDNFVQTLKAEFETVEVIPSYPDPRVLLLCTRGSTATRSGT
jgi:SAM-dependent methyltransferase